MARTYRYLVPREQPIPLFLQRVEPGISFPLSRIIKLGLDPFKQFIGISGGHVLRIIFAQGDSSGTEVADIGLLLQQGKDR